MQLQYMVGSMISWMTPSDQFSMLQCGHRVHPDAVAFKGFTQDSILEVETQQS